MLRSRSLKVALVIASATVLAASAAGLTYAATTLTTGNIVYACANSGGTLRLLTRGHCPTGYRKVGLNKQGPQGVPGGQGIRGMPGPAGPGTVISEAESSSGPAFHDTPIPGLSLTMHAVCQPDPNGGSGLYLQDTDASAAYSVDGSYHLAFTGGGRAVLVNNGASQGNLAAGLGPVEYTQPPQLLANSEFVAQLSAGGTSELTADVSVTRGAQTAVVHVHVYETATHCVAQGWATPTT